MASKLFTLSLFLPILLILLASLYTSSEGIPVAGNRINHRTISSGGGGGSSNRSLLGIRRNNPMVVDCSEMASLSLCSQKPNKCRWCRSEALDDMCFSKSEAWRLPPQLSTDDQNNKKITRAHPLDLRSKDMSTRLI
ncbi:hypothetical protein Vadar_023954 [Vaccinium darrowii]|uniref:Uncharacterized protein n=1 Tax=Vaccinium darrowii TaxID=229202 RepID=A0ACB7XJK9_9ERIC|nr:hypothetical protein Vadar_023954 [Vaccinium darrowii]